MQIRVILEFDPETASYSAVSPELPGCSSAGSTEEEARQGIEEAIHLYHRPDLFLAETDKIDKKLKLS